MCPYSLYLGLKVPILLGTPLRLKYLLERYMEPLGSMYDPRGVYSTHWRPAKQRVKPNGLLGGSGDLVSRLISTLKGAPNWGMVLISP